MDEQHLDEDFLSQHTYKGQCQDNGRRVFYTLTDDEQFTQHRTAKAVSLLIETLVDRGTLTEHDLDLLLMNVVEPK